MKILFCTDGSKISYNAIKNFSEIFNNITSDVISVSDFTYMPDSTLINAEKYTMYCADSVSKILEYSKEYLSKIGIKTENFISKCGNAVDSILEIENKNNYDFIVMGSNGKKGFYKWLGSVSQEVASYSKSSLYISKSDKLPENIVFPVAYNQTVLACLKELAAEMNFTGKTLHLLNVYEIPEFLFLEGNIDSNWASDVEVKQIKEADKILNSAEMLFVNNGIIVKDKIIIKGNITEQILKYIVSNKISLVVTGMKKRKTSAGISSSSISRRILENAPCDVMIYKE